ncbi:hypothetical protein [Trichocoleus sp. FACHB-46]|uniref:Uncharacterized protein n=1 Tax=Trichocoleus desertorum GB2-A4 TaxID=2933944 RepID=A0ABV0JCH8_9CYAN|nr:hypothetical protein [Trichocoleus sp. FACHB-46]
MLFHKLVSLEPRACDPIGADPFEFGDEKFVLAVYDPSKPEYLARVEIDMTAGIATVLTVLSDDDEARLLLILTRRLEALKYGYDVGPYIEQGCKEYNAQLYAGEHMLFNAAFVGPSLIEVLLRAYVEVLSRPNGDLS